MSVVDLESFIIDLGDIITEQVVDDSHGEDGLQMCLLVGFELFRAVQVDGERGDLHEGSAGVPVSALERVAVLDDNFASERKITVEPSSP